MQFLTCRCSSYVVFSLSSFCCLLSSDLYFFLSRQLVGLLHDSGSCLDIWIHPCSPTTLLVGWPSLGFLRWGHSSVQKLLLLHYYPENEIGKHMVQVIFTDLYVTIFTHGLHASNFSVLLPFLLGLEWYLTRLCPPHLFLPWCFPWSPKLLEILSPLIPKRLCSSHLQLISHFSGYLFINLHFPTPSSLRP